MADLKADVENGNMSLEERLQDMNIDPAEYKAYEQLLLFFNRTYTDNMQAVEQSEEGCEASCQMGAQDARGCPAKMEGNAVQA